MTNLRGNVQLPNIAGLILCFIIPLLSLSSSTPSRFVAVAAVSATCPQLNTDTGGIHFTHTTVDQAGIFHKYYWMFDPCEKARSSSCPASGGTGYLQQIDYGTRNCLRTFDLQIEPWGVSSKGTYSGAFKDSTTGDKAYWTLTCSSTVNVFKVTGSLRQTLVTDTSTGGGGRTFEQYDITADMDCSKIGMPGHSSRTTKKMSTVTIALIAITAVLVTLIIVIIICFSCSYWRKRRQIQHPTTTAIASSLYDDNPYELANGGGGRGGGVERGVVVELDAVGQSAARQGRLVSNENTYQAPELLAATTQDGTTEALVVAPSN